MSKSHPDEFIGEEIKVIQANNKSLEGIEGRIVLDTKNTFRIMTNQQEEKTLLKKGGVFLINNKKIKGEEIIQRPEERIKLRK